MNERVLNVYCSPPSVCPLPASLTRTNIPSIYTNTPTQVQQWVVSRREQRRLLAEPAESAARATGTTKHESSKAK